MSPEPAPAHSTSTFATQREDTWWLYPLSVFLILTGFVVFATYRVFTGPDVSYFMADDATIGYHYLSPFGTPDLTGLVPAFMHNLPVLGTFMSYPAFLVLPFPAGFRFTCYYYRKAYYRSFVARPAGCATEAARGAGYQGERRLLIIQNFHRYFLYAALVISVLLAYDAAISIYTPHGWYFGFGSVLMVANVVLLLFYTLGCHSFRHLIGGRLDCFSCDAISMGSHSMWKGVTKLNKKHGKWAMSSLFSVALTDAYIWWLTMNPEVTHLFGVVPV